MESQVGFTTTELIAATGGHYTESRMAKFQDVDAAGIVFFPRLFEYFHDAYIAFLHSRHIRVDEVLTARTWAAPLRRADAEFLRPIRFGDDLSVSIVKARVVGSELTVGFRIAHTKTEKVAAVGWTLSVFVTPGNFRRMDVPAEVGEAFRPIGQQS